MEVEVLWEGDGAERRADYDGRQHNRDQCGVSEAAAWRARRLVQHARFLLTITALPL
jgi:hypothetical protein